MRQVKKAKQAGFTLIELLIVILIVGILAAVAGPLYFGYIKDARLAEAKALAGGALSTAQVCIQQTGGNNNTCDVNNLASKMGIQNSGVSFDNRFLTNIALSFASNNWNGNVTVAGRVAPVDNMAAGIFFNSGVPEMRCNLVGNTPVNTNPPC